MTTITNTKYLHASSLEKLHSLIAQHIKEDWTTVGIPFLGSIVYRGYVQEIEKLIEQTNG